jgi:hypothetical protein
LHRPNLRVILTSAHSWLSLFRVKLALWCLQQGEYTVRIHTAALHSLSGARMYILDICKECEICAPSIIF